MWGIERPKDVKYHILHQIAQSEKEDVISLLSLHIRFAESFHHWEFYFSARSPTVCPTTSLSVPISTLLEVPKQDISWHLRPKHATLQSCSLSLYLRPKIPQLESLHKRICALVSVHSPRQRHSCLHRWFNILQQKGNQSPGGPSTADTIHQRPLFLHRRPTPSWLTTALHSPVASVTLQGFPSQEA